MPYLGIAQGLVVKTGQISASDARKQKRPYVPPKATLAMGVCASVWALQNWSDSVARISYVRIRLMRWA